MVPLPFRLKVAGKDLSAANTVAWSSFRLSGLLTLAEDVLGLEWGGVGTVDAVTGLDVRSDMVTLPTERLEIPLRRVRSLRLRGGWWQPRLELTTNQLRALASVPSSEGGCVQFWIARSDRALAATLVAAVLQTARSLQALDEPPVDRLPVTTPPDGSG